MLSAPTFSRGHICLNDWQINGFCYSVNVITFGLAQDDHIRRAPFEFANETYFWMISHLRIGMELFDSQARVFQFVIFCVCFHFLSTQKDVNGTEGRRRFTLTMCINDTYRVHQLFWQVKLLYYGWF